MKLGIIFLESLLEAGVNTISDNFFSEFGKTTTTLDKIKSQVMSIKNKAKEGYLNSLRDRVEDPDKIADIIAQSVPSDELKNVFSDIAKRFVESVFLRLKFNMPENLEYSPNIIPNSKKIPKYELGQDGKLSKISTSVEVSGKEVTGYISIAIEFPKGGLSPVKIDKERTILKYTPKDKDPIYLVHPEPGKQYYTSIKTGSAKPEYNINLTAAGKEASRKRKPRKQDRTEQNRKNIGVRDLFYATKKRIVKASKDQMLRIVDFINGEGEYTDINADREIRSIFKAFESPVRERGGNEQKMKDRMSDILDNIVNLAIDNELVSEDDVDTEATVDEIGEEKDGKRYFLAKKGPVAVAALVDANNYVVYLKSPDKDRLTDVVIYDQSLIN
jgi:hypothetical protein